MRFCFLPSASATVRWYALSSTITSGAADSDSDERAYSLCQHEQCLERREETTSYRTGKARMAAGKSVAEIVASTSFSDN